MAKGFPIYSDLIIKLDPKNVNMVQAQLKQTLSSGSMSIDIAKPIGLREYEDALKRVRRESTGLIGDMQSLGERSTRVFARFSAYLLASGGILASISLMKDAIGQALKFNSELIRIKQVSGDSNAAIGKLADEVGRLSKNLGVSSSELIKSAVTLKQAGLSVRDTTKALETLAQAELAPNFDSMAKTTEGLIAIYQQFGKNIDKVKTQLGSLNAVAGEFAVEASDLITVVQKAGGAAASSGASLEQLLGLFTSVRATTRESADSIATGLRTIFGRLQRPETIKFLDELGIKMRYTADEAKAAGKNAGDFVGPFEAILRISAATANMGTGSTLFSNLVEQIGGLRQISRVVPLIKESSLAVEAWNVALAGQNSLYINSLQKQDDYLIKLKKIQEMFLEMGRNLVASKGFEDLVSVLGSMAKAAIQLTDALGPLLPYLTQLLVLNTAMGAVRSVGRGMLTSVGYLPAQSQKKMATGGIVPGSGNGDKVPALLEPGEAVIPKNQVSRFPSFVNQLISGGVRGFADGGVIGFDDNYNAELRRREILKKQKEGIFTSSGGIYKFQNESTLDYIGSDNMPKLAKRKMAESKTKKGYRSSSGRFESIFNIDEDDSFSRDAARREEIQRRYAEDKIRTEETLKIQKDAEIAARKRREIAERKEKERTVLSPYRSKILSSQHEEKLLNAGGPYIWHPKKPAPDIFSFASNPPPPPPPPKPDIYRQYSPNEWGVLSNRGIGNQSQSGINPMYGISEDRNARQFVENQKRLEKLLAAEVQAKAYMKTGEVPTNASRRVQEYILNPETSKQKIKNLQIAQGMISAGGVGPMKMQQPGSFRMSLPVIGMDGRYSTEEEYNLLASASARKQGGLTIQDINSSAALYNAGGNKSIPYDQLNQSKVPFTPGGIGGNQNYVPPKGPFGFGRGGGSGSGGGGSGSGGGGGSSSDSNDIPLARAAKDFRREKIYGGLSSLVGIGVPLALGAGAAFQKDEETQSRLGAASIGAGIGGQLGSLGGPLGTIVGTAIGGIVGWFVSGADAVKDAAKKLQAKKLDESVEKLNIALEDLSEGRGSIGKLAESLSEVRQNAFKNAKENLKPGENLFQKSQDEFQKLAGINLAKYQKEINEQLKKQAQAGQGPLLQGEFNEVAKSIVQIRQRKGERFTMQDYEKQLKTTYDAFAADKTRKDADIRFVQQIDASVHSAKSFADAVQKAADSAAEMDKNISILSSGGYSTPSLRLGEYGGINQKNLSSLSSFGGGVLSGLTSQVGNVNQVSKYLPEVLSRIIKPGEGANTDTSISGAFEEAFNNIAKQTGEKFDKKVLSVLSNKLESMKTEDLFENFKKAPEQFADEMIKSFEPALKALESIGKNLEARDEAYQRGLSQLKEMNNKRNELFAQRNSINLGLADISDEMFNSRAGITGQSPRFANARNAFVSEQQRLAPGLDINTIGDAISQEKANLRILQEKASEEARAANGSKIFADKVLESENRLNNLNKALSNLTNRSEELSRLQARRSTLEARIESKLELTKSFYSADRQGLLQMNRNFGAARALKEFGPDKIRQNFGIDFGADVFQRGMGVLEGSLGNVVLEKRRVKDNKTGETKDIEYTGKMIAREILLKSIGLPGAKIKDENEEINKILQEITSITSDSKTAVDIMIKNLNNDKKELYGKLQENNKSFTDNLNKLIDELSNNARTAETAKDRTRLNEISPDAKASGELIASGLNIDSIRKNAKQIKDVKEAQATLDNVSVDAEKNAASAEFYIKQNLGKEDSSTIANAMSNFGYSTDSQQKIKDIIDRLSKQQENNPEVKKLIGLKEKNAYFDSFDKDTGLTTRIPIPKEIAEYDKRINEAKKRSSLMNPEFSQRLRELQLEEPQRNLMEKRAKLAPGMLPATRLSDEAMKLAESKKDPQLIQKETLDLQKRIAENEKIIKDFESKKANAAKQNAPIEQQRQDETPFIEAPRPQFRTIKENRVTGQAFNADFDKTFTDFNANFGKQVEALAAIPKVIEMNVKQTVEVIINGAGAMAMLEPTMKKVADAAVIKGIETIGGQLRAANIKINYDPNADGGAA